MHLDSPGWLWRSIEDWNPVLTVLMLQWETPLEIEVTIQRFERLYTKKVKIDTYHYATLTVALEVYRMDDSKVNLTKPELAQLDNLILVMKALSQTSEKYKQLYEENLIEEISNYKYYNFLE